MRCMRNLHRLLPRWRYQRRRKVLHRPRYLRFLRHLRRFLPQRCYHRGISFFLRHNTHKEERDRLSVSLSILDKPTSHLSGSFWVHKGNPMSVVKNRNQPFALDAKMALMDHWCCLLNLVGKDAVCRAHYPSLLKKSFWKKPTFPTPGKENTNKTKPFPV